MNTFSTKTTIFFIALALASRTDAFVPQSKVSVDTQLNALWRNWIPQTTDLMDMVAGPEDPFKNRRDFVVSEPLDENDTAPRRRSVSLISKSKAESPQFSRKGLLATTAATLLLATSTFVQAAFAVSGGGLDFAGLDISNQDFSNGNYKGKDFTQVLARNTNFAGSNLQGCRFPKAYLINANYEGADVRGVSFEGTNMENTNLKNVIASGAYFGATVIDAANVENADFTDAQFPPKTLALMCDRPDMKGTNPTTGADTRESAMCP